MARLQILELPTEHHGDDMVTPFVLVIDRVQKPDSMLDFLRDPPHLRDELGARTILVFDEDVEIPADNMRAIPAPASTAATGRRCGEHNGPCFPEAGAKCVAHGDIECLYCHRNPADCANGGNCGTWSRTGMHWDTCANRVRGPLASDVPDDHQLPELVYAHERTRLDLCSALLVSGDTTWRQLIEQVAERQRELAGAYRKLDDAKAKSDVRVYLGDAEVSSVSSNAARDDLLGQINEARLWARHGYEIGQKHCGWTDHGVAPAWLTDGWKPGDLNSCEHLKRASEYDEALTRVQNLPEHPDVMDAKHPNPDAYLHGYRVAIRDAKRATRNERTQTGEDRA